MTRPDEFGPDAVTAERDEQMGSPREPAPVREYVISNPSEVISTTLRVYARWDGDDPEITQIDIYPDAAARLRPLADGLELSDFTAPQRIALIVAVARAEKLRRARNAISEISGSK